MTSLNYIEDTSTGTKFIPSSQRPDGTWRKPIKVRDGYVPQEEQPLYVSKGKQPGTRFNASAPDFVPSTSKPLYFEVGQYQPATIIPGLNFIESSVTDDKKAPSKKKKSKKPKSGDEVQEHAKSQKEQPSQSAVAGDQNPIKRLRNLKKKLKDIQSLETKLRSGELQNPEKDQLEKIKRKQEVVDEINQLESCILALDALSMS